ncbi:GDP-mannose 4,6-dehydratase [Aeromicrobium massiliense]|uniref:GDP-mannose 4,6-dehydratase n=1 Tax=Aeromicrobium massiliense TaxID=1464554 RepID=UPI0002E9994B|nr:GDP-mannose 4,6-dehydratase [Aeromicrobium massiliense]
MSRPVPVRTLVTGGAGFVGSHLVELLLSRGDEVVVLDDLSTGRLSNLDAVANHSSLGFVHGSVLDRPLVERLTRSVDRVFHLAAQVGVDLVVAEPLLGLRTNIHGTENVLECALAARVPVLLVSTSEIYGKNTADKLHEDSDRILGSPLLSRWTYAAAKGIDEAFAHAYWKQHGLQVSIVRLFNTVGPRQVGHYGMVVPRLVGQALRGEPLTVHGDGQQTRCFSFVGDVVPAMVALAEDERSVGQAFNLGGAEEVSILDLARRILQVTGSSSSVRLVPYAEAYAPGYEDMRRRVPDNTRAQELVGFVPRTALDDVIAKVAESLRDDARPVAETRLVLAATEAVV